MGNVLYWNPDNGRCLQKVLKLANLELFLIHQLKFHIPTVWGLARFPATNLKIRYFLRNPGRNIGYDCACNYPYQPSKDLLESQKGLAGYSNNNKCEIIDDRNYRKTFSETKILFGGGWNPQKPDKQEFVSPSDLFYGLEETGNPLRFRVVSLPARRKSYLDR